MLDNMIHRLDAGSQGLGAVRRDPVLVRLRLLAETIIGRYKTEVVGDDAPLRRALLHRLAADEA